MIKYTNILIISFGSNLNSLFRGVHGSIDMELQILVLKFLTFIIGTVLDIYKNW